MRRALPAILIFGLALTGCQNAASAAESYVKAPAAKRIAHETGGLKVAVFAGGCFWGIEAIFSHLKGVKRAVSGYHGGGAASARYSIVGTGLTGHAEAVRIVYDPAQIRYDQLVRVFFSVGADPTLRNRQGPDKGTQYRAALVPTNQQQRAVATAYLAQMGKSGLWKRPIVTRIEPYRKFYPAETYHQDFLARNPHQSYIVRWDKPKLAALKRLYPGLYRSTFLRDYKQG